MELKRYLRVLARRRGIGAATFFLTSVATVILVTFQGPVYEAGGTALLHPRQPGTDTAIDASDLLVRGVKIAETYASVARSELIRERAEARLGGLDASGVTVTAEVVTDTNILSITARGGDPEAVPALAAAVMDETIEYVVALNDPYLVSPLDEPRDAGPIGSNKGFTIALGALFGLVLAVILASFAEYLDGGLEPESPLRDEPTGLRNEEYLKERVAEEMSRADGSDRIFALAAFRVAMRRTDEGSEHWGSPSELDLKRIGEFLPLTVPGEVVIGHLGEGEFAAILPDMDRAAADRTLARWETGVSTVLDGHGSGARATSGFSEGVCVYSNGAFDGDREAVRAARRLTDREASTVVRARTAPVQIHPAASPAPRGERRPPARAPRSDPDPPRRAEGESAGNGARRGGPVELHAAPDPEVVVVPPADEEPARGPGPPKAATGGQRSTKASKGRPRANRRR
jgi:capsular polysaccharide biosynthesis protein/GGDEF domain-containing protein